MPAAEFPSNLHLVSLERQLPDVIRDIDGGDNYRGAGWRYRRYGVRTSRWPV